MAHSIGKPARPNPFADRVDTPRGAPSETPSRKPQAEEPVGGKKLAGSYGIHDDAVVPKLQR
jgi:hypothetical protein